MPCCAQCSWFTGLCDRTDGWCLRFNDDEGEDMPVDDKFKFHDKDCFVQESGYY